MSRLFLITFFLIVSFLGACEVFQSPSQIKNSLGNRGIVFKKLSLLQELRLGEGGGNREESKGLFFDVQTCKRDLAESGRLQLVDCTASLEAFVGDFRKLTETLPFLHKVEVLVEYDGTGVSPLRTLDCRLMEAQVGVSETIFKTAGQFTFVNEDLLWGNLASGRSFEYDKVPVSFRSTYASGDQKLGLRFLGLTACRDAESKTKEFSNSNLGISYNLAKEEIRFPAKGRDLIRFPVQRKERLIWVEGEEAE